MKKKTMFVILGVAIAVFTAGLVIYQLYSPLYEPLTEVEYPGSTTNVSLPSITPDQSLTPLSYRAYGLFPKPGAKNVPLITHISVSFIRPPGILKLEVEPEVKIWHVKKELIHYSGKYTFYLTKPLQPGTNYTVTIIAGHPISTTSWQFTTISTERMIGIFFIILIIVFSTAFIGMRYKRRKDVRKRRKHD